MKKISLVILTVMVALSANAFAAGKHHTKHPHATKSTVAPAPAPAAK
ncbi:hypothetical protein [Methylotenera sp. 1P/1]|nr:hypothetical protein [Methylotenera sp. 1P/1]